MNDNTSVVTNKFITTLVLLFIFKLHHLYSYLIINNQQFLQDGTKVFPPQLNTPPTPFADRETLEKELKALEQDLGDLRSLTNPSWLEHDIVNSYADSTTTGLYLTKISLSQIGEIHSDNENMQFLFLLF